MEKLCRDCGKTKDISEFRKDSRKKSGYGSYCKTCSSARAKKWQRENPELRRQRDAAWYRDNKERKKATDQARLPKYRARRSDLDRAKWLARTPEERREKLNRWYWANDKHVHRYHRARLAVARAQGADWSVFPESLEYVQLISDDPCVYCGDASTTIDHIVPVSRGGTGEWKNLAPACVPCNSSKQADPLLTYLLRAKRSRVT